MTIRGKVMRIAGHDVTITRPDKVLFPQDGITKQELVEYYCRIAPWILPHLRGRPLAMERYPDGIGKPGFFQKIASFYYPSWIETVRIKKKLGGPVKHVICNDAATLAYVVNQACVTPHVWLSRSDKLDYPDQMVFDLDPAADDFEAVKATAQSFKELLDQFALPAYLKSTGSRGLHVAVPLKRNERFDAVRTVARQLAKIIERQDPAQRTLEQRISKRRGRVFLDVNRNAYAQTVVCPYAVRARAGAPVSVPLDWNELRCNDLRSDGVTIRNVFKRLEKIADPWLDFQRRAVSLSGARRKLEKFDVSRRISQEAAIY